MKIIHCADLHIGSKINNIPIEKSKVIKEEIITSFERLCQYAVDNGVAAVIIAGDMFDSCLVSLKVKNRVFECIKKAKSVDFLYLSGNHDEELDLSNNFDLPDNFKVLGEKWSAFRYGKAVVAGANFSAYDCNYLADSLKLNENDINIVSLHGEVLSYNSCDVKDRISLPKFKGKFIDYLAMGHIHSYTEYKIDERGTAVYSGALYGRGFDEIGDKGFVLLEENNGVLERKFISLNERKFTEYSIDVGNFENFYELKEFIQNDFNGKVDKNDVYKLILKGEMKEGFEMDINSLNLLVESLCFYCKIVDETKIKIDIEKYMSDNSVVGEFVREVMKSDIENLTKLSVIMCGINALKGEEI